MATTPRRLLGLILAAGLTLVAAGCSSGGPHTGPSSSGTAAGFPVTLKDDDGVSVTMKSAPQHIVTFSPSDTETVFALGLGDRLVGVSGPADNYPAAAKSIPHVGAGQFGTEPNVEKIVALHADVVLYSFTGSAPWMDRLRSLHIPVFTTLATSLDDTLHDIDTLGRLLGAPQTAATLTTRMRRDAGLIERSVAKQPAETCFYEISYNPLYTVGPGSLEYDLLQQAGCRPVTGSAKSPYPQWSVEALLKENPDVYFVASESATSAGAVGKRPGYSALTAVKEGRVDLVISDLTSRPGPRIVEGLSELARALHPEAFG